MIKKIRMKNRKLVIVSNAGINKDLQGIDADVRNYVNFFRQPEGGLWDFSVNGDAICYDTNSIDANKFIEVLNHFSKIEPIDYWVIVFVGHGGSDPNKGDVLEICPEQVSVNSDCSIWDIRQAIGRNTRAVLIADCCRSPIRAYESGGCICEGLFSDTLSESEQYRKNCLELYHKYFMMIPLGAFFVAQACSYGECSSGNSKGGYYSFHLLEQAKKLIEGQKKLYRDINYEGQVFSLSYVHTLASPLVTRDANRFGEEQNPEYSGPRCNQPPLCVVAREPRRLIFG